MQGNTVYMLAGGGEKAHWVRNLRRQSAVRLRIRGKEYAGEARVLAEGEEEARARALLYDKYSGGYSGDLENWRRTALPVAVDLAAGAEE